MIKKTDNDIEMRFMLLQESVWKLEDQIDVILESVTILEAELRRLKRLLNLTLQRLEAVERPREKSATREGENGQR